VDAILLNVSVFRATNNVRENVAAFLVNAQSSAYEMSGKTLSPNETYTWTPKPGSVIAVVRSSKPVLMVIDFTNGGTMSKSLTFIALDTEIQRIVFTNQSTTESARLGIIAA
jgi:hypothetical protein